MTSDDNTPHDPPISQQTPSAQKSSQTQPDTSTTSTKPAQLDAPQLNGNLILADKSRQQQSTTSSQEPQKLEPHVNGQIELVEHTPDQVARSVEGTGEDSQDSQEGDSELKRVKVYELIGARWVDQGTAFCFGQFQEDTCEALLIARSERDINEIILTTAIRSNDVYQRQQDTLIVWTEPDGVDYALSFQDPEGCAEVWNFILEVQRHMHHRDDQATLTSSSPLIGPEVNSVTTASIIRSGHLPPPQLGIIGEIERAIKSLARTQSFKDRICEYIQQEDYIKALINVAAMAEDLESLDNLHALCSIMQTILMMNDHSMYEHILEDDLFPGVCGMLEYDPEFPGHKANYRQFLREVSRFHHPVAITDNVIQRKIHHTYRLQFLKDVVLARALDDSTFNVLNSCIIFNQVDIITHLQQDATFMRDVVRLFVDENMLSWGRSQPLRLGPAPPQPQAPSQVVISLNGAGDNTLEKELPAMDVDPPPSTSSPKPSNSVVSPRLQNGRVADRSTYYAFAPPEDLSPSEVELRREVILLIQQLCVMGKNVQLPARMSLFRMLVDRGILFAVQWALGLPETEAVNKPLISAAGEILSGLLDHDLGGVRGHVLKQVVVIEREREAKKKGADKAETILELICRLMAQSMDLAVQSQVGDALKVWMDLPGGEGAPLGDVAPPPNVTAPKMPVRKDDPGSERHLDYFYKHCIHILFEPLGRIPEWRNVPETILPLSREETNRYVYLCDLLHNFVQQHHFRSSFFVATANILIRIASLLKARDKHLRHAAFRIFRLLLKQNNPATHSQLIKLGVLKPILDLTIQESRRDNLLSCSCQEFFESMRRENMKDMITTCMTKHEAEIRKLATSPLGGQRFEMFIRRYEMMTEPPPTEEEPKPEDPADKRWSGRAPDMEEENYFNDDDDDEEDDAANQSQLWSRGTGASSPIPNIASMRRKRRMAIGNATKGYRPPLRIPNLTALVDYGEDDDDDLESTETKATLPTPSPPDGAPSSSSSSPTVAALSSSGSPPPRPRKDDSDDEDDLLETLARRPRPSTPTPGMMSSMWPGEKRRRSEDDDDDDEMLERLSKSKKVAIGTRKESTTPSPIVPTTTITTPTTPTTPSIAGFGLLPGGGGGRTKNGDDPPKKLKLKFNASFGGSLPPSPSPSPAPTTAPSSPTSEAGAKDGDTG